ncbi:lysylphosphatidylglycerol synthase transmembrane domain-containing protein [Anaerotignum sp.]|uniref:lysylphosphatidylglycerol synthase transmembrane domain-containing protein n=1 Tax=Anaerotignum sp. TaxID=2039241 RepID=UPI002A916575|nr:lysylphosphatidylglycerol synthase transmembrane domain-containing protein [Anaerotignum sp.]MCI7657480.1 flippase-like domain-containing protein [Clostridia bacterium]MDY5415259.1 lysylphosphatidylglycerol synthase transmembrane domain-containing protein [Anaerotignum sp.]
MARKYVGSVLFLCLLIGITIYVLVENNDMRAVAAAMVRADQRWILAGVVTALFFVAAEGSIICYLLRAIGQNVPLLKCVSWSFIGFFFSGITPSATGGQPAQLFYMKKAGLPLTDSTPVLMVVAVLYKFVLAVLGLFIAIFCHKQLGAYFQGYYWLFYLGIGLNAVLVIILVWVMVTPVWAEKAALFLEGLLVKIKLLHPKEERKERLREAVARYGMVVRFFQQNPKKIVVATGMTLVQRSSLFFLTWLIYRAMGLEGVSLIWIMVLQATVYIAVDMLPFPGSAGISELVYAAVFASVFSGSDLAASMCISRGISFYLVLLVSMGIWCVCHFRNETI